MQRTFIEYLNDNEAVLHMKSNLDKVVAQIVNATLAPLELRVIKIPSKNSVSSKFQKDDASKPNPPKFVNVGSGSWTHPLWHTLDQPSDWYAPLQGEKLDYQHNLMSSKPLPFESNSLEAVFCSHVIEHLPNENVQYLFNEVFRILAPGGYFRVTCPDIKLIYDAFRRKDSFFMGRFAFHQHYKALSLPASFLHCFAGVLVEQQPYDGVRKVTDKEVEEIFNELSLEEALDYFTKMIPKESQALYPAYHLNWFHDDKILEMLKVAGFEHRYVSAFGQSRSPQMIDTISFDTTQPWMSIYVECFKS